VVTLVDASSQAEHLLWHERRFFASFFIFDILSFDSTAADANGMPAERGTSIVGVKYRM
jgi:hypothetical protein